MRIVGVIASKMSAARRVHFPHISRPASQLKDHHDLILKHHRLSKPLPRSHAPSTQLLKLSKTPTCYLAPFY